MQDWNLADQIAGLLFWSAKFHSCIFHFSIFSAPTTAHDAERVRWHRTHAVHRCGPAHCYCRCCIRLRTLQMICAKTAEAIVSRFEVYTKEQYYLLDGGPDHPPREEGLFERICLVAPVAKLSSPIVILVNPLMHKVAKMVT